MNTKPLDSIDSYVSNQRDYNEVQHNSFFVELAKRNLRRYLKVLEDWEIAPSSLLDAGCREGYILSEAEEALGGLLKRPVGLDIVPEFIKTCEDLYGFECHLGDIHEMPFDNQEFDSVYCSQTLEHAYDVSKAASELFRVAKKSVFIGVPIEDLQSFVANKSHYIRANSELEWFKLIDPIPPHWKLVHVFRNKETPYLNMIFLREEL